MLKLSVVIPVYNSEKYLCEAIQSVLSQTLSEIELIFVNDGSVDNSLKILEDYSLIDKRIRIINKDNSGYGASVNKGLSAANGEYVAIFEPDDILLPNIYATLYNAAEFHNLDVVKCNFYNYWSLTGKKKPSGLISRSSRKLPFAPKDNLRIFSCHASVWAGIYRKRFLEKHNIRFLETPGASYQDMSFTFKVLSSVDQMLLLKTPLLYYRQDNPNSSINNASKVYCVVDEYEEIGRFLDLYPEKRSVFTTQKLVNQYRAYLWNLKRLSSDFRAEFLTRFSTEFQYYYYRGDICRDFFNSINYSDFQLLIEDKERFMDKVLGQTWWNLNFKFQKGA